MQEMTNLPMPLAGLPISITKEFQDQDKGVLSLILNKPKPFKDFENKDKQILGSSITTAVGYLGIRETLTDEYLKSIVNILCEQMPNFTTEELEKAIIMASMGKFEEFDNNHYNQLTPMYLSSIVKHYQKHRSIIYQKYKRIQDRIRREKPNEKISEKDMFYIGLDLVQSEFDDYTENIEQYCDSEYRNSQVSHIYSYLTKHKLIEAKNFKDVDEQKTYIVSWFKAISKKDTTPRTYISKRFNIPPIK